jgi:hypothetical protein
MWLLSTTCATFIWLWQVLTVQELVHRLYKQEHHSRHGAQIPRKQSSRSNEKTLMSSLYISPLISTQNPEPSVREVKEREAAKHWKRKG